MANHRQMRTLIYKRTHEGDPDPQTGVFGNNRCMGQVRSWEFNAVIGVGGIGREARCKGIARKLTWIGIARRSKAQEEMDDEGNPLVSFDHFLYYGKDGPRLKEVAPALAKRMYDKKARVLMDSLSEKERLEVERLLDRAREAAGSGQLKGLSRRNT